MSAVESWTLSRQEGLMLFFSWLFVCCVNNDSCMSLKIFHCYHYILGISMEPRSAFYRNKWELTACLLTLFSVSGKMKNGDTFLTWKLIYQLWVLLTLVCWMWSAVRRNSPRPCRVKGGMLKRDLTLPHTDWLPRPLTQCSHFRMTLFFF